MNLELVNFAEGCSSAMMSQNRPEVVVYLELFNLIICTGPKLFLFGGSYCILGDVQGKEGVSTAKKLQCSVSYRQDKQS